MSASMVSDCSTRGSSRFCGPRLFTKHLVGRWGSLVSIFVLKGPSALCLVFLKKASVSTWISVTVTVSRPFVAISTRLPYETLKQNTPLSNSNWSALEVVLLCLLPQHRLYTTKPQTSLPRAQGRDGIRNIKTHGGEGFCKLACHSMKFHVSLYHFSPFMSAYLVYKVAYAKRL